MVMFARVCKLPFLVISRHLECQNMTDRLQRQFQHPTTSCKANLYAAKITFILII